ncbi:MAG: hypothetical protein ACHQF3_03650 [Alphaproteobacteria bacterium]
MNELVKDYPYITWNLDAEFLGDHKSYVNVAFWRNASDFYEQVAKNFNDDKPMLCFEKYRRRRVVLDPVSWRIGQSLLPPTGTNHPANVK